MWADMATLIETHTKEREGCLPAVLRLNSPQKEGLSRGGQ
jgi:hypothetical protein